MKQLHMTKTSIGGVISLFILSLSHISYAQEAVNLAPEVKKQPAQRCYEQVKNHFQPQSFSVCGAGDTIYDNQTGLMWSRCSLGKQWNQQSQSCEGEATTHNWKESLTTVSQLNQAGYLSQQDWRLPNIKELGSLVDLSCVSPAIDATVFPDTGNSEFWTSSVFEQYPGRAWYYNFELGNDYPANKRDYKQVRMVRQGNGVDSYNLQSDSSSKNGANGCVALSKINGNTMNTGNSGYSLTPKTASMNDDSGTNSAMIPTDSMTDGRGANGHIIDFNPVKDVATSSLVTSDEAIVNLPNASGSETILIAQGEYEINGNGDWRSAAGTVNNGDRVKVRHMSSQEHLGEMISTVHIGNSSATFKSTTIRYVF